MSERKKERKSFLASVCDIKKENESFFVEKKVLLNGTKLNILTYLK